MKKSFIFVLLCAVAQIAWTQSPIVVTTEAELLAAVTTDNAAIRLDADIDLSQAVTIDNLVSCSVDLNGHTIDRHCSTKGSQIFSVRTGSDLTLSNGTLTGGWGDAGGAILNEGTMTLTNVTISGNRAANSGGAITNNGDGRLMRLTSSRLTREQKVST